MANSIIENQISEGLRGLIASDRARRTPRRVVTPQACRFTFGLRHFAVSPHVFLMMGNDREVIIITLTE